jgi:hypothetical protein
MLGAKLVQRFGSTIKVFRVVVGRVRRRAGADDLISAQRDLHAGGAGC